MVLVFMVAEKPMLALSIAGILSNNRSTDRKGWNGACPVIEYDSTFRGKAAHFKMTSTCGHVMGLDFPQKFNDWEKIDPARLYDVEVVKKEANPKLKINDFLASEAKNADYVVLWLDCDKEGENICFEVIDAIRHVIYSTPDDSNIYRARFSAISSKDINEILTGHEKLGSPKLNESLAVDARQELDLRIGCAFTRFQTKFFHSKYGDLDSSLVSFGPCQTPTLGFCVARYDQIQSFKPESYWVLQITLSHDKGDLKPEWARGRLFDRDVCNLFADRIKNAKEAVVTDVSTEKRYKTKPLALNSVELMRVASAGMGMGPLHCMAMAEQLYTQGFISYPRTETTQYPEQFDAKGLVRLLESDPVLGPLATLVLSSGVKPARKGKDVGDHPPITPMKCDSTRKLSGDQFRVFEYIVQHFLATVSEDCCYLLTTAHFRSADEEFVVNGKTVLVPGFTCILNRAAVNDDEKLPVELKTNQKLLVSDVKVVERETTAPDYLTESELISLMEQHGIGTDASIPVHINNICQRNYVTVSSSGRKLVPTRLGIVLVHGYWKIDPDLVQPTMRAAVETQLDLIAKGRSRYDAVTEHALKIFRMKFEFFVLNICLMDELFEVSFSSLADTGKPFTRCGVCRRYMKLISAKPVRLHCSNCQQTYSLPQAREPILRPYSDQKCPLDDFDLLYWSSSAGSKGYSICPYCYNNPPFPDMQKHQGCNECSHPGCKHSVGSLGIAQCPKCPSNNVALNVKNGILVLDPISGPKWKISCNKCPLFIPILDGALKIKILPNKSCSDCESQLVTVEYKAGQSKLTSKNDVHTGCIFCDDELKKHTNLRNLDRDNFGPTGSRGGFRGRRGRGRGRGSRRGSRTRF